jgi:methylthioribose-1-phosphate isomerase
MHLRKSSLSNIRLAAGFSVLLAAAGISASQSGQNAQSNVQAQQQGTSNAYPTDAQLLKTFADHRQAFDRLRQMVVEDARQQGPIFSLESLRNDLPSYRKQEYRTLIASIR